MGQSGFQTIYSIHQKSWFQVLKLGKTGNIKYSIRPILIVNSADKKINIYTLFTYWWYIVSMWTDISYTGFCNSIYTVQAVAQGGFNSSRMSTTCRGDFLSYTPRKLPYFVISNQTITFDCITYLLSVCTICFV